MEISSSEEGAKPSSVPNQPQAGVLGPVPNPLPLLPQINLPPQPAGPQSLPLNPPPGPTPAAASLLQPQPTQLLPGAQQQQSILEAPIPASVLSLTPKERPAGPRPVATSAVPGTPWSIVWSSDDRMFFFNATTRASVWSVPSELVGNQDVERMLDNPPPGKSEPLQGYVRSVKAGVRLCSLVSLITNHLAYLCCLPLQLRCKWLWGEGRGRVKGWSIFCVLQGSL